MYLKSTNLLERLNEEIKRRTNVVRIFRSAPSCLRLIRALAVGMHENRLEAHRYLNMPVPAGHPLMSRPRPATSGPDHGSRDGSGAGLYQERRRFSSATQSWTTSWRSGLRAGWGTHGK